ncbi:sensor histidine kinase [Pedobacter sp. Leaf250]|uniref:sensor histidine kinase n=1 Tax=Pedobacter sp. Leaf250 TaxID=2876559 RepID=UPI001E49CA84|nr:ATP-binding protein [Pedobacter sp. Leaf250]
MFIYLTIQFYFSSNLYKKNLRNQRNLINLERERISSEIHDEIGSGLTAIKLYAEHASKSKSDVKEIQILKGMIDEISQKINEIIWSTNSENDHLESLVYFIEDQVRQLFKHSKIYFQSEIEQNIPETKIDNQGKRECYLLIKEIAHNALKHSKASKFKLTIYFNANDMIITVKDNGIGFDFKQNTGKGMGLENIRNRAERINGTITIEQYKGTMISVKIPLKADFVIG